MPTVSASTHFFSQSLLQPSCSKEALSHCEYESRILISTEDESNRVQRVSFSRAVGHVRKGNVFFFTAGIDPLITLALIRDVIHSVIRSLSVPSWIPPLHVTFEAIRNSQIPLSSND